MHTPTGAVQGLERDPVLRIPAGLLQRFKLHMASRTHLPGHLPAHPHSRGQRPIESCKPNLSVRCRAVVTACTSLWCAAGRVWPVMTVGNLAGMLPFQLLCKLQGRCEAMELVIVDLRQQLAGKVASGDRWQQECKAAQQQLAWELDQRQHFQGEAAALKQQLASVSLHAHAACSSMSSSGMSVMRQSSRGQPLRSSGTWHL